jgi:predicted RecB family nuclease
LREEEKEKATIEAMERGDELIYSGRIKHGNLLGIPDLLKRDKNGYVPGDIKSGAGMEGASDLEVGKPKKHYAVQLALYTDILEQTGYLSKRTPFVWDIHNREIEYNLDDLQGYRDQETLWDYYRDSREEVENIVNQKIKTRPALSAKCKLCHWRSLCKKEIEKSNDLTLIPELGRSTRDKLMMSVSTVQDMAAVDIKLLNREIKIPRLGFGTLQKFQTRAKLLSDPESKPVITGRINFPEASTELFFDVETDPMRDLCYLHGFVIRKNQDNVTEEYVPFFADHPDEQDEKEAFAQAVEFIQTNQPCRMYYYSKYERTIWRKLQEKYPEVIESEEIEHLFSSDVSVDLYFDVIKKKTEWPTNDLSIKTLARYLGFNWRDEDPSGASSIEWYHCWVEKKDEKIKQRILDYNEDDCRATRVLLDGIMEKVKG